MSFIYPVAEAENNKENMTVLIKKTTSILVGVGVLPLGLVILFGSFSLA